VRGTSKRARSPGLKPEKTIREAPIKTGMSGSIWRRLITFLLIVMVIGITTSQLVQAEPPAITAAKSEADALREIIDQLNDELAAAVEDYNYATAKLAETQEAIKDNRAKLAQAEEDLGALRAQFTERIVEIYKQGDLGMLDTLLGATSFSELINRLDLLQRLSEQDSEMVSQVEAFRTDVTERRDRLAVQLEEEKVFAADAETARLKVEERLAANEKALAGKETQIAQLEKEEAERQARLAAEARAAAKKAAEEAARKKAEAAAAAEQAKTTTTTKAKTSDGVKVSVPDSVAGGDVVSIAMEYLGTPYVWAGASPSGFDCSGFVQYVYKKLGVSLPHSSRMQYGYGTAVSRSNLQPGDLLFFYSPIHHVAIYIGDGRMIHAAGVGKGVRIDSVWTRNYTGARRII